MPLEVTCSCGKQYRVGDELAGKRIRCSACGQAVLVPDFSPSETPFRLRAEPEDSGPVVEEERTRAQRRPRRPRCYCCEGVEEGMTYSFYTGRGVGAGMYRNMERQEVFLCRSCAIDQWRKKYLKDFVVQLLPLMLLVALAVAARLFTDNPEILKGARITLGVLALIWLPLPLYNFWKIIRPTLYRPTMEYIAIDLWRKDFKKVDGFFTTDEYRAMSRVQ